MKLLYLHPNAWTGEYPILGELRRRGLQVCVLEERRGLAGGARLRQDHFREPGDAIDTLWYDPGRGAARLLAWPLDRVFRRAFDGRNLAHRMLVIREAVALFRPDIVVCTDGFTYAIPAAFLRRLGRLHAPLVASYIGGDILDCPEAEYGRRRTTMTDWMIRASLPGIDALRPVCDSLARVLLRDGAAPERIHMFPIQMGTPLARLATLRAHKAGFAVAIRARYGIPAGAPLVITLSGNQKGKGIHLLAAQWARLCAEIRGCHWLLCGPEDPWLTSTVRPLVETSGYAERVHFTGRLAGDSVYEHLAAADLHVNPTLCEGLNVATVDAAAMGTPSITSDGAGIADWVARHGFGEVVAAGDAQALGRAVCDAFADPARLARWSLAAPGVVGEFGLDTVAARLVEVFASVASSAGGAGPARAQV